MTLSHPSQASSIASETPIRKLVLTRLLDAPCNVVWRAWTEPERLAHWWGPRGFTNPVCEFANQPGGEIRIEMRGPDGTVYPMSGIVQESIEPQRLVFTASALDENGNPLFENLNTVTFTEANGKTTLNLEVQVINILAPVATQYLAGMEQGWRQSLDRLEEAMAQLDASGAQAAEMLVITRVFNAPRDLVFKAWTEAEHLAHWWGPKGFNIRVQTLDFQPGGLFHYYLETPDGQHTMWGRFEYRDILPPERLVFINAFSDAAGNIARGPFSETWPLEVLNTLTFTEQDGKTTLTLQGIPIRATAIEREAFQAGHPSMQQGFKGTLDQLEEYLARVK